MSLVLVFGAAGFGTGATAVAAPPDTIPVPESTLNEFIPEDRPLSDCISAVPKPGCGSEARSDWHQFMVWAALLLGLSFVAWRIVAGVRRQPAPTGGRDADRSESTEATHRR